MSRFRVLVISSDSTTGAWLAARLDASAFDVTSTRPGPSLLRLIRERRPELAVLDGIDARPGLAQMEVALLKDQSPGVRIVARCERSSERDADVVELGIFCYLADRSLDSLLRVVQAAAGERNVAEAAAASSFEPVRHP
jgi:DNA-binding response OmpR family regulator